MIENIHWLGHDCFRLEGECVVYIDPFQLTTKAEIETTLAAPEAAENGPFQNGECSFNSRPNSRDGLPKADLILITHEHYDHYSPEDIAKIQKETTEFVAPASVAAKLKGKVHEVKPHQKITLRGVAIETIPAYNTNKKFHPQAAGHVGYILTMQGQRIYHSGDADLIPEMEGIKPDIALLPVSGTYVMTAEEAAEAARRIQPKFAVPMHYGSIVGSEADAVTFQQKCPVPVRLLKKE